MESVLHLFIDRLRFISQMEKDYYQPMIIGDKCK